MADANLKPRRSRAKSVERVDYFPFVLEEAPYDGFTSQFLPDHHKRPAFPWQRAVDRLLATAGFVPGSHVLLSLNYRSQQLTISPDSNYRIANREMPSRRFKTAYSTTNYSTLTTSSPSPTFQASINAEPGNCRARSFSSCGQT
ncbi:hypothetical protein [Burkholderia ubonensis]|uniref:hypothetical protein n=1 Tax=Burkholderia ubonensis TaxID=101571 RepID=UPI0011782A8E|nr:hypothetical protein [Burkholderia ubonensis]